MYRSSAKNIQNTVYVHAKIAKKNKKSGGAIFVKIPERLLKI
jgi:hypothetical protein